MRAAAVFILVLALVPAVLPQAPGPAAATDSAEYEKRLAKIRKDIEALKSWLQEDQNKERTTLSSLDRIGATKSLIKKELGLLSMQLDKNRADLAAAQKNIPPLATRLEQEREALVRVLVTLFKFGRLSFSRFLFQAPDLRTLTAESQSLTLLASAQDRMIAEYGRNLTALGQAAATLTAKESEIRALLERAASKKAELEREEEKTRILIGQIRADRKTHEQTLDELARRAEELQVLLQRLEKLQFTAPFPLTSLSEMKGRLPWPASGRTLLQTFGIQRHPQFNTVTMNNGIEIAPLPDDLAVRAVQGGRIAYADRLAGYGNLIILDHGFGYHSLYGHCAELLVKSGDFVRAEQPIAVAGDAGSLVGVSVYFEVRYQTKPVDPLQWLSRR